MLILALAACLSEPEGRGASGAAPGWSATVESAIAAGEYAPQVDGAGFMATNNDGRAPDAPSRRRAA